MSGQETDPVLRGACPWHHAGDHAASLPVAPPATLPDGTIRAEYQGPCGARWVTWWRNGRPVEQREEAGQ